MPITDSNLAGNFISNTYQKILQTDSQFGHTGTNVPFTQANLVNTSKHSLLNGSGNKVQVIAIEGSDGGTGLFLKNTTLDANGAWGLSTLQADVANSNSEAGLSFWRPSPSSNSNLHKLFLKNTGTLWVGYQGSSSAPGTGIVPDVSGYSLYTKGGIRIETTSSSSDNGLRIKSGTTTYYPIEFKRFNVSNSNQDLTDNYAAEYGGSEATAKYFQIDDTGYSSNDWNAAIIGYAFNGYDIDPQFSNYMMMKQHVYQNTSNHNWGFFIISWWSNTNTSSGQDRAFVDVMFTRKEISFRHPYPEGNRGASKGPFLGPIAGYNWKYYV